MEAGWYGEGDLELMSQLEVLEGKVASRPKPMRNPRTHRKEDFEHPQDSNLVGGEEGLPKRTDYRRPTTPTR